MKERDYKFYYTLATIFIVCLILGNVIAGRVFTMFGVDIPASIIVFPMVYIVASMVTEFFGASKMFRLLLVGYIINIVFLGICMLAIYLPVAESSSMIEAYATVFGLAPRIMVASIISAFAGIMSNAAVMVWIKKATKGKMFWARLSLSAIVGQLLDSVIFISIAFIGTYNVDLILMMILIEVIFKILYQIIFIPMSYYTKKIYNSHNI